MRLGTNAPLRRTSAATSRVGRRAALRRCRLTLSGVGIISGIINVLALTGSLYMLQVYDRVLGSRSVLTLFFITLIAAVTMIVAGLLRAAEEM